MQFYVAKHGKVEITFKSAYAVLCLQAVEGNCSYIFLPSCDVVSVLRQSCIDCFGRVNPIRGG